MTPMFSRLEPPAALKEKRHGFCTCGYELKRRRERHRGPLTPSRDATGGHRRARASKGAEASYVGSDSLERWYHARGALFVF